MKGRNFVVLMLVMSVFASFLLSSHGGAADRLPQPPPGGEPVALGDLDLRTPAGEQVSLIPLIGRKGMVVVFWASWCPICRSEVPHLNRINADTRIKVIAVNVGENVRKVEAFMGTYGVGYPVVLDPDGRVAATFRVPGMPACVIIGKSGRIAYRGSAVPEDFDQYLDQ